MRYEGLKARDSSRRRLLASTIGGLRDVQNSGSTSVLFPSLPQSLLKVQQHMHLIHRNPIRFCSTGFSSKLGESFAAVEVNGWFGVVGSG